MSRQASNPNPKVKSAPGKPGDKPAEGGGIRGFFDELIFICVIVMFFRMFVVELYKIPSGSMTPTLLGGSVARVDFDGDGMKELLFFDLSSTPGEAQPLVYKWNPRRQRYIYFNRIPIDGGIVQGWRRDGIVHDQFDRILVSKIPYIFRIPRRGDIVVFKVPPRIYTDDASIFIKRVAGLPGESLSFNKNGRLMVNDQLVNQPDFYQTQLYESDVQNTDREETRFTQFSHVTYFPVGSGVHIERILVPDNELYAFGDNALGSLDSRFWGGVPIPNAKGRAFLRIWPLNQIKFLH